jgi:serine/threonine-protein kinase HipA
VPSAFKYQAEGGPGVSESITLLREATAVPAIELPRFWDALVFNWLIGNCDAHGKNYSLLYDAGSPTLAPDVNAQAWVELATRVGVRQDFATDTGRRVAARAAAAAERVAGEQGTDAAAQIARRVIALAADARE